MLTTKRPPPSVRTTGSGFTLIELLVVVSVITVLLALLLPALSQAKGKAKGVRCGANLRAIYTAYATFKSDINPHFLISGSPGGNGNWFNNTGTTPTFMDYYKKQDVCWCPEVASIYQVLAPGYASYSPQPQPVFYTGTSYSFSIFAGAASVNSYQTEVTVPTDTIFLGDSARGLPVSDPYVNMYHGLDCAVGYQFLKPATPTSPYSGGANFANNAGVGGVHGRHNGLASMSWYDGHVTTEVVYVNKQALLALVPPPGRQELNTLLQEKVGFISPVSGDYATVFSQEEKSAYYYWMNKELRQ